MGDLSTHCLIFHKMFDQDWKEFINQWTPTVRSIKLRWLLVTSLAIGQQAGSGWFSPASAPWDSAFEESSEEAATPVDAQKIPMDAPTAVNAVQAGRCRCGPMASLSALSRRPLVGPMKDFTMHLLKSPEITCCFTVSLAGLAGSSGATDGGERPEVLTQRLRHFSTRRNDSQVLDAIVVRGYLHGSWIERQGYWDIPAVVFLIVPTVEQIGSWVPLLYTIISHY